MLPVVTMQVTTTAHAAKKQQVLVAGLDKSLK